MCGMPQKSTMISAGEPRPFTSRVVRVTAVDMSARAGLKKPSAAVAARTNWRENGIDFLRSFWALSQASICHAAAAALNCTALPPAMSQRHRPKHRERGDVDPAQDGFLAMETTNAAAQQKQWPLPRPEPTL